MKDEVQHYNVLRKNSRLRNHRIHYQKNQNRVKLVSKEIQEMK